MVLIKKQIVEWARKTCRRGNHSSLNTIHYRTIDNKWACLLCKRAEVEDVDGNLTDA